MNAEEEKQQFIEYINDAIKDTDTNYSNWCVAIGDPMSMDIHLKRYHPEGSFVISKEEVLSTRQLAEQAREHFVDLGCTNHREIDSSLSCQVFLFYKFVPLSILKHLKKPGV